MKKTITFLLFILALQFAFAQNFQGEATYKTSRKIDIQLDSTQMSSDQHKLMLEMVKKQFQKTFILSFNKEESIYKEDKPLESPQPAGVEIMVVNTSGSDVLYKNLKEKRYTNQNESFSKLFLIKDKLQELDWEMTGETKFIGDYECYKATTTREEEVLESGISINGDKDLEADMDAEPKMREVVVTAWYAPAIPVNNGPQNYHGLPGLILEVNDGTSTMICSKIVLNPDKKVKIEEPTKGKELDQAKYDEIMEKKIQEMQERMRSSWSDDGGQNVEIRIGG
ncbi:GLPGLI family protein [Hanstruepera marina]|uniref:GLPGLI family protein n=1 Tax=Hanstruepera marina TaxID=2873265 RepID=UPI001CA77A26|nr:GLPGLI family protein [Hanstruepera marina]